MIVFNWKMNPTSLSQALKLAQVSDKKDVVLCPPFIFLSKIKLKKAWLGAQDCFWQNQGAFTGQTSPLMLKKMGCSYVIIGHSERKEKADEVNLKIKAALKVNLKPIVCVTSENDARKKLKRTKAIIAYEPLSAIGTNKPLSLEKADKVRVRIKKSFKNSLVLYGGSVNSKNYASYLEKFDGLLVGTSSLKVKEIKKILS
jgi:triosephosphate isomerase (TIM)